MLVYFWFFTSRSTIFQSCWDRSSLVVPVLSIKCLAQGQNTETPPVVRHEQTALHPQSNTLPTEPLCPAQHSNGFDRWHFSFYFLCPAFIDLSFYCFFSWVFFFFVISLIADKRLYGTGTDISHADSRLIYITFLDSVF